MHYVDNMITNSKENILEDKDMRSILGGFSRRNNNLVIMKISTFQCDELYVVI